MRADEQAAPAPLGLDDEQTEERDRHPDRWHVTWALLGRVDKLLSEARAGWATVRELRTEPRPAQ
jgi:hypothetical protein